MPFVMMSAWLALAAPISTFIETMAASDCCTDETSHRDCPVTCSQCVCCSHRLVIDVPALASAPDAPVPGTTEHPVSSVPAAPDPRELLHVPISRAA
jgi:hypothetical protein